MSRITDSEVFNFTEARKYFESPKDPGYIYVLRDRGRYKVGRSTRPKNRIRNARTWIPDLEIIGVKPFWFHSSLETYLQVGLAQFSFQREWFEFNGDEFENHFTEAWTSFKDKHPELNNRDFTYFINGTGMADFTLMWSSQHTSKSKFLREMSNQ